jgi:predicted aspartyl protease
MEILTMGKVVVAAKIENQEDVTLVERGISSPDQVRSVEVADALVDTGATMISLPKRLIAQLGLRKIRSRTAKTTAGIVTFNIYSQVKLTVQERECLSQVAEIPDECPVLIGQIPLELLDFVVVF